MTNMYFLDFLRGISALAVLLGHLRGGIMIDLQLVVQPSIFDKVFYFFTGFGHEAVVIFFVLSGYLVGGTVLRSTSNFSYKNYFINRLSRLLMVLLPALLLTLMVDFIYYDEFQLNGYYSNSIVPQDEHSLSIPTLLGNIFFLQTFYVPIFGINGPLWSLAYEFWFYCVFPLFVVPIRRGLKNKKNICEFVLLVGLVFFLPFKFFAYLLIWMLGALSYFYSRTISANKIIFIFSVGCFVLSLVFSRLKILDGFSSYFLIGLSAAFLIAFASRLQKFFIDNGGLARASKRVSDFSYSIYLFHFPLIFVLMANLPQRLYPSIAVYSLFFIYTFLLIFISWVFYLLFEKRTYRLRNLFELYFYNLNKKDNSY